MKSAILLLFVVFYFTESIQAQSALHDQTINTVGTAVASQNFESSNASYDCMAADDFTVPSGEQWHIDSIVARGHYVVPIGQPLPGSGIIIHIYEDGGGFPDSLIYSDTNNLNVDLNFSGILVARLSSSLVLDPGHYWVGISARKDAGTSSTQWEWFNSTSNFGDTAHWKNPGNGFNLGCTSYDKLSACLLNFNPGMSFSVFGCPIAPPEIFGLASNATICTNDPLTISVTSSVSSPVWSWSTGASADSIVIDETGQYIVSCKDSASDCVTRDTIDVFAIEPPEVNIEDDTICSGDTLVLSVQACAGCSYAWSNGDNTPTTEITMGGQINVVVTEPIFGCNESDTAQIDLITLDSVEFDAILPLIICDGDTALVGLHSSYESYLWSTGSEQSSLKIAESGTYSVTVSIGECSDHGEIVADVALLPNVRIGYREESGTTVLYADSGYVFYEWSTGENSESIIVNESGSYNITVTDSNGCQGSALFNYSVGVAGYTVDVQFYPVPVDQKLTIETNNGQIEKIAIYSMTGEFVRFIDGVGSRIQVDLTDFPTGHYVLSYALDTGEKRRRIIYKL